MPRRLKDMDLLTFIKKYYPDIKISESHKDIIKLIDSGKKFHIGYPKHYGRTAVLKILEKFNAKKID